MTNNEALYPSKNLTMSSESKENKDELIVNNKPALAEDSNVSALYIFKSNDESNDKRSSVGNEIKAGGWTPMLMLAGAICCLGSAVPAGYNIGVINNAASVMKRFCNDSIKDNYGVEINSFWLNTLWSSIVSIFLIGGVTGSLISSVIANKLGRRGALAIGNVCGIIGAAMLFLVPIIHSVELFLLGRLIVGLSGGLATSLLPTYMTEIAPLKLRGAVGVLCQLGITCGVLLGQIASLENVLGNELHWNYMLAAFSPLCFIALLFTYALPESPKYLFVFREEKEKALHALSRFRNMDIMLLKTEIDDLESELANKSTDTAWTIIDVIKDSTLRLPLILVCLLQLGQQLSGVNAVFYYSKIIFQKVELSNEQSEYAIIGTGIINIGMALISVPVMSCFGRRTLLFVSAYSTIGCLVVLCASIALIEFGFMRWVCIAAVLAFVLFYGIGLGPIPYFIGSELFDVGPRVAAMSLGSVCNWGGNFIVGMTFPFLQEWINSYSFLVFATCILVLVLFSRKYLPETRGKTTTEIAASVSQGLKSRPLEGPASNVT
ncbi:solute carrier family 2, facilitated glucose transporter member 1-like [Copidosoma floridanum]|uniref:solute carrier family 2, facilitated glucose transporter member 1-like n=1 Tax=Copidosoma floridanum TaxID=29053 RepID=UPI0006C9A10F|nr:solute carrier family 2, facilitated glucose transporter member 1-like [Copidosoma floridanum]